MRSIDAEVITQMPDDHVTLKGTLILAHFRKSITNCLVHDANHEHAARAMCNTDQRNHNTSVTTIQCHRGRYQSKARMRFPISD